MAKKKKKAASKKGVKQNLKPIQTKKGLKFTLTIAGILSLLAGLFFTAGQTPKPPPLLSPTATPVVSIAASPSLTISLPNSKCHINGQLPDKNCTPGVIDTRVTQANIQQTICVSGYSATIRPPVSYTNKLEKQQIQEYGYADTDPSHYEEDHLISLQLGGHPTDPRNLWPEPGGVPNPKDKVENRCHKKVCDGTIPLAEAQKQIATDWTTACQ